MTSSFSGKKKIRTNEGRENTIVAYVSTKRFGTQAQILVTWEKVSLVKEGGKKVGRKDEKEKGRER